MVFKVGFTGLCCRFTRSMCAVEGVAVVAMFVPQRGSRIKKVGLSSLTAIADKEELSKYPSYLTF